MFQLSATVKCGLNLKLISRDSHINEGKQIDLVAVLTLIAGNKHKIDSNYLLHTNDSRPSGYMI